MTQIISSISGYFSKPLILGTFLPVVVFMLLTAIFAVPFLPLEFPALVRYQALDNEWKTVATSFIAIVITGLIYNLNIPILRLYEGYPWRSSWLGTFLIRRHQSRFDDAQNRISTMKACRHLMETADEDFAANENWITEFFEYWKALGSPFKGPGGSDYKWLKEIWTDRPAPAGQAAAQPAPAQEVAPVAANSSKEPPKSDLQLEWEKIYKNFNTEYGAQVRDIQRNYPVERNLILPTRLGNVIRSFEYYPGREYRIDSVVMWPRLVGIIPKDYAVAIDDAKTIVDFMLNASLLSLIVATLILLAGLAYPVPLNSWSSTFSWLGNVAVFALISYFFYRLSIDRVSAWGSMVNGAFDLYRFDLLKKLGYQQEPDTREKERALWYRVSRQTLYGDLDRVPPDYVDKPGPEPSYPAVSSTTAKATLELTKGVKVSGDDSVIFYLRISNTDEEMEAADVTVTDKLPDDLYYLWESARVDSAPAESVSGPNPYVFKIGSIAGNQEVVLTYKGIRRNVMN